MKIILLLVLALFSVSTLAQECATNIQDVKELVGNKDLSMNWIEKTDGKPVTISLANGSGNMKLTLKDSVGELAKVSLKICRSGEDYKGVVQKIVWGPSAPGFLKGKSIKSFKIKFIYQTEMKVSWFVTSFVFEAR